MKTIDAVVKVRGKNQVTLPDAIARRMGIEPGDRLIFELDPEQPGQVQVRRLLKSYAGILEGVYGKTTEEVEAYIREERASWGE